MHFCELRRDLGEGTESGSGQGPRLRKHLLLAGEQLWVPLSGLGLERTEGGGERGAGQRLGGPSGLPPPEPSRGDHFPSCSSLPGDQPLPTGEQTPPLSAGYWLRDLGSMHYTRPIYKVGSAPSPRPGRVGFVKH